MKKIKYTLPLLCLFFILTSCETVVEVDLPTHEPKLVVNAVINPDSILTVDVSASQSALSNQPHGQVENATVQVYHAGQLLYTLPHTGNGKYKADQKPQVQQHYELKVEAPGLPKASATTYIPAAPLIRNLIATPVASTAWSGTTVSATFTLTDAPGQENFYYIQAYTPDTSYLDAKPFKRSVSLELAEPFEYEFTMEDRYFFSDKLFEGKAVTLRLHLENSLEQTTYIRIAQITRAYYDYVRTLDKQSYRDNFATPPGPVFNNIAGGLGLFAGYNATVLAVKP
ncbi:DUF4249 domain-containing protein [uncultured Pontibacter sp.]|uniref:DUF4249 domain-containing protein n=1 Tax=uncultured Pontibacter sp. TaxID=453356 RepID=UPI00260739B4|nr:DUF4249 domain-containing protein [uncultured Pontibacter sp.]